MRPEIRRRYYDGWFYRQVIDRSLKGLRQRVRKWIPAGSTVIDIGCGTGDQLFALADLIKAGVGIELSTTQISSALQRVYNSELRNLDFQIADASDLSAYPDHSFDLALCTLVIHELAEPLRVPILREMKRIARKLILVDWEVGQHSLRKRIGTHLVECMAGRDHYSAFRSFNRSGGMPVLIRTTGLTVEAEQMTSKGTMRLWLCS